MQGDLEPVVGPGRTELVPFLGGLVCLSLGLGKIRLGASWCGPDFELDVCSVIDLVRKEECR